MFKSINGGRLPERATLHSAGFDVFANEDIVIGAGETVLVGLGICLDADKFADVIHGNKGLSVLEMIEFKQLFYLELHPRSSLRAKGLGGGVGIIDIDYEQEIKMVITNPYTPFHNKYPGANGYEISKGDKIGQLILKRHEGWLLPSEYTKQEKRIGGFGSSGE